MKSPTITSRRGQDRTVDPYRVNIGSHASNLRADAEFTAPQRQVAPDEPRPAGETPPKPHPTLPRLGDVWFALDTSVRLLVWAVLRDLRGRR